MSILLRLNSFPLDMWEARKQNNDMYPTFATGYYYHIYNRGVEKRDIFMGHRDYSRFLETVNFYRKSPQPVKLSDYKRGVIRLKKQESQIDIVKIFCYCLMPNHFHLLVQPLTDKGMTDFLRKLSDSYTRYFNTKHDRIGPLFQGRTKAKLIESDEYLLQLSKYIHRNSFPLTMWEGKKYPYSTYDNYLSGQAHAFCDIDFIGSYFSKSNPNLGYQEFVDETEPENPILWNLLVDGDEEQLPTYDVGSCFK